MTTATTCERGIMFMAALVRAILEDRKTQTRRIIRPQPPSTRRSKTPWCNVDDLLATCPWGTAGGRMWVRENFAVTRFPGKGVVGVHYEAGGDALVALRDGQYYHFPKKRADAPDAQWPEGFRYRGWLPSIHMPRFLSRMTLDLSRVRVERLTQISEWDARSEGVPFDGRWWLGRPHEVKGTPRVFECARDAFLDGFRALHGLDRKADPWLWVLDFARVAA